MSRHRNIRNIDLDDELDDYDDDADYCGRSYEEEPMSPSTAKFLYQRPRLSSQLVHGTKLSEFIAEEASGSDELHNEAQEIFHFDEDSSTSVTPKTTKSHKVADQTKTPAQKQNLKVQLPSIQQLKISEQKHTRSGSKSPARGASTTTAAAPATVPKLSALDMALAATPNYKPRSRPTNTKESINLIIIGHVDAGKSTLMGHLLFQMGYVEQKVVNKYKQDASRCGKSSFFYAWILDETEEERARGVTMDIARASFETPNRKINILDAPGHKDFIPNMITGASKADAALLVVNSTRGEFETAFDQGGQTREHSLLVRSLGVSQMVVAVNKLDTIDWSKERYDEISAKIENGHVEAGEKVYVMPKADPAVIKCNYNLVHDSFVCFF
uniref:Tr-type G domain-containing protein n=1 Tax=Acrobeloides nanus TaxID=290746 RepID=A0A914CCX3_9BILA